MARRGFVLLMVLYGAMYTYPALTSTMASDLRTSRTALQGAFALWTLTVALCAPLAGRLIDRRGVPSALFSGGVALVLTLASLGLARNAMQVYVALVGFGAPAHALLQVGTITIASRTNVARRGRTLGVVGAGMGFGLTLLLPSVVWISERVGWRAALLGLAGLVLAIYAPTIMLMNEGKGAPASEKRRGSTTQFICSRPFLLLFTGGIGIGLFDEVLYQHLVPRLVSQGMSPGLAGVLLGMASLGYISGQIMGGWGSDTWGRWPVGLLAAVMVGAGLFYFAAEMPLRSAWLWFIAFLTGAGLGATIAVRSATLADIFHGPSLGLITGTYQWAYALGGAAMGWGGAYIYERVGSYSPVFVTGAVAAMIWVLCLRATLVVGARKEVVTAEF